MKRFIFSSTDFFGYGTITLTDNKTLSSVEIALRGANVLNYKITKDGKQINLIDGFSTKEEFETGYGARSFIMAPYSNKIKNEEYEFYGQKYKLNIDNPELSMRHGFVSKIDFEIFNVNIFDDFVEVVFYTEAIRATNYKGYPFDVDVFVRYRFSGDELLVEITGKNIGKNAAPFGSGWHSYFKTNEDGIDNLNLELNADKIVLIDNKQVPLADEEAYALLNEHPEIDFRNSIPLEKRFFGTKPVNVCFTELTLKNDGFFETILNDFENKIELTIFQHSGVTYVYTGDDLKSRSRKSVAIEPVEFMTDSYNRSECAEMLELKPGKSKNFVFGVKVKY